MSDIAKRLRAALRADVVNGDEFERGVLAKQIQEAITELDRLEQWAIPLCIGLETIGRLSETGHAEFSDHPPLIAADSIYGKKIGDVTAAFEQGFIEGLREYAWWKDGVQYVGTCGTTLTQAIERAKRQSEESR